MWVFVYCLFAVSVLIFNVIIDLELNVCCVMRTPPWIQKE